MCCRNSCFSVIMWLTTNLDDDVTWIRSRFVEILRASFVQNSQELTNKMTLVAAATIYETITTVNGKKLFNNYTVQQQKKNRVTWYMH